MAKLPKTKNKIQNLVIVCAMLFVFTVVGTGFFIPTYLEGENGTLSNFQQDTLNNFSILVVVIISGAIGAIALDKKGAQETQMTGKLIAAINDLDPNIVKKAEEATKP